MTKSVLSEASVIDDAPQNTGLPVKKRKRQANRSIGYALKIHESLRAARPRGHWRVFLGSFELNEVRYEPTTLETYKFDMRTIISPATSKAFPELEGKQFSVGLFTAVSASKSGDIRYVIAIERVV